MTRRLDSHRDIIIPPTKLEAWSDNTMETSCKEVDFQRRRFERHDIPSFGITKEVLPFVVPET